MKLINPLVFICLVMISTGCQQHPVLKPEAIKEITEAETHACYLYASGHDSVMMKLTTKGNRVAGELMYHYFGKDKNKGRFSGTMQGDTLFADYTFFSEGIESVREVCFLKKENGLLEGFGDMDHLSGSKFADKNKVSFPETGLLIKTGCN